MFNNTTDLIPHQSSSGRDIWILSDEVIQLNYTINLAIVCLFLSIFGIVTNIINMIVFFRMGFTETINISLFGLAISDFFSVVPIIWVSICYNPFFMYSDLPVDTVALQFYPGGWTHLIFTRITGFITVFIALERCFCIAFPLKVKGIMTRSRVTGVVVSIYVFTIATMLHKYFATYLEWRWDSNRNKTILGIVVVKNIDTFNWISWPIQFVYPIATYLSVVVFTIVFVWKLNHRGKWLQTAISKQEKAAAIRDRQVIKMVVVVACIFIVCYIPSVFSFILFVVVPDIYIGQKYENMFIFLCSLTYPTEVFNSSVNIFIYYKMMSKYKEVFKSLLQRKGRSV